MAQEEKKDLNIASIPDELMKEVFKEQQDFVDDVFNYALIDTLDDVSQPLSMKEKRSLKKYDVLNVDAEKDFDGLIMDLAKLRGVSDDVIDEQSYSELSIWVRKVAYGTFNLKKAAKK